MKIDYSNLEKKIDYKFKNKNLLVQSLTHKSFNKMNNNEKIIYLFTQKEPTTDDPQVNDVYSYGVKSKIIQFLKLPDNTYKVLTEGLEIVKIKSAVKATNNFLKKIKMTMGVPQNGMQQFSF